AADEGTGDKRRDDNSRILLRHANGIAGHVFVDDQVADDGNAHPRQLAEQLLETGDFEAVTLGKFERFADRGYVHVRLTFQQRERGETQLTGGEDQPSAICFDGFLLGIGPVLELLALDNDTGLQSRDKGRRRIFQTDRIRNERNGAYILETHLLSKRDAWRHIRIDADHEDVGLFGREFQEPQMPRMDYVEVAGDERDGLVRAARGADRQAH